MSMIDDLQKAMDDVDRALRHPHEANIDWARGTCALFIQTHGKDLLDAVQRRGGEES
jgi:hypothetical protein